jgi:hypothetical protein
VTQAVYIGSPESFWGLPAQTGKTIRFEECFDLEFYENIQASFGVFDRIAACNEIEIEAMRYRLFPVVNREEVMEHSEFLKLTHENYLPFKSDGGVGHR